MLEWWAEAVRNGDRLSPIPFGMEGIRILDTSNVDSGDLVGEAEVAVTLGNTIGVPGEYSSVKVVVRVTLRCEQSDDMIRLTQHKAESLCAEFLHDATTRCYEATVANLGDGDVSGN